MNKFKIIFALLVCFQFNVVASKEKQFPVPGKVYVPGKDIGFGQYMAKSLKGTKKIVLTFDDGPDIVNTPLLLDTLKQYDVQATFFILTERINTETLPLLKRMIAEGHNLADHHLNHINNDSKSEAVYKAELIKSIRMSSELKESENALYREIYYRFPYGAYGSKKQAYHHLNVMKKVSQELFGDNCINFAFWDIDTVDWIPSMTSDDITQNVMANIIGGTGFDFKKNSDGSYSKVKISIKNPLGGGVVLMHDVHLRSVNAVPKILEKFRENKIEVVSLQDVKEFSYNGIECRLIN
jgi:peptidoglycan/xylan/chitin deacetylase (PgdA/CDA1 family)